MDLNDNCQSPAECYGNKGCMPQHNIAGSWLLKDGTGIVVLWATFAEGSNLQFSGKQLQIFERENYRCSRSQFQIRVV